MFMNIEAVELAVYKNVDTVSRILRPRFTEYLADLYKQLNNELESLSLEDGDKLSYLEVVTPLLNSLKLKGMLNNVDLLFLVNWSPEIDPEHSSYGPHLIQTWLPKAKLYNVGDQGLMSLFTALKLIRNFFNSTVQNCLILIPEQNTFPLPINYSNLNRPVVSGAGAIKLTFSTKPDSWRITEIDIQDTQVEKNNDPGFMPFLARLKQALCSDITSLKLVLSDVETTCQGILHLSKGDNNES